jgi:hypothetical protein
LTTSSAATSPTRRGSATTNGAGAPCTPTHAAGRL